MAGSPIKSYAKELILELQGEIATSKKLDGPVVDVLDCTSDNPLLLRSIHNSALYDEADLHWLINPNTIKKHDAVTTIKFKKNEDPIAVGILNGHGPDPTAHPRGDELKKQLKSLQSQAKTWKSPVLTVTDLPQLNNGSGDIRLVTQERALYVWDGNTGIWESLTAAGGVGGADPTKLPLAGGTLTGDLIMDAGTMITLPDAPVSGTDVTNKDYVDSVVGTPSFATLLKWGNS